MSALVTLLFTDIKRSSTSHSEIGLADLLARVHDLLADEQTPASG